MNDKLIDFVICTNNRTYFEECCKYLETLTVPEGFTANVQAMEGEKSMTSGYNHAISLSDAKYRVYMHQDVFIINRNFIQDLLEIFKNPDIGMVGIVGCPKLPRSCVMWEAPRVGKLSACNFAKAFTTDFTESLAKRPAGSYYPVECIDGLLMATQYDIPWREDLFDGWDFYDVSQSFEFGKAGKKVVVPLPEKPWVIHDDGLPNYKNYDKYKEIFKNNYKI